MTRRDAAPDSTVPDAVDRAADLFLHHGEESPAIDHALMRRVERAWEAVGHYADSPELMVLREQALARARRASARRWRLPASVSRRRWLAATVVGVFAILGGVAWQLSLCGFGPGVYRTDIGEQKIVALDDRSVITLDAKTRLKVDYSADSRIVKIMDGQAQFSVARDPARPFKVIAGDHAIVAVGTVFTVEYIDHEVRVATLEGKVAVLTSAVSGSGARDEGIPLASGEALRVRADGKTDVTPHADLAAVTAWRQRQVIFHDEPLAEAVRRLNRYSRVQIKISDPELAQLNISGLFDAGDTRAFVNALQSYLPIIVDRPESGKIELRMK